MAATTVPDIEKLPALPEDITAEWLGSKLGHKVKSIDRTRAIWGTASKLFYTITYEDEDEAGERPTQICIKGVFDPAMIAGQPWTVSLAQREAAFFSKVAPQVKNMIFPKGWWSGVDDKQGIAIMNDLTQEGCTFAPEVASFSVQQVKNGVEQLAGLHARFWGQSQKDHPCKLVNCNAALTYHSTHITYLPGNRDLEQLRSRHEIHVRVLG